MRIEVIRERCEGHGLCEERAAHLYALDDEGFVVFRYDGQDVPEADRALAAAGARVCPVAALIVREEA